MKFEQGKIIKWENKNNQEIVFLVVSKNNEGVVIHSDSLISVGTLVDLTDYENLRPFIGTVHLCSEPNNK